MIRLNELDASFRLWSVGKVWRPKVVHPTAGPFSHGNFVYPEHSFRTRKDNEGKSGTCPDCFRRMVFPHKDVTQAAYRSFLESGARSVSQSLSRRLLRACRGGEPCTASAALIPSVASTPLGCVSNSHLPGYLLLFETNPVYVDCFRSVGAGVWCVRN